MFHLHLSLAPLFFPSREIEKKTQFTSNLFFWGKSFWKNSLTKEKLEKNETALEKRQLCLWCSCIIPYPPPTPRPRDSVKKEFRKKTLKKSDFEKVASKKRNLEKETWVSYGLPVLV
jgi:hypothetical protein